MATVLEAPPKVLPAPPVPAAPKAPAEKGRAGDWFTLVCWTAAWAGMALMLLHDFLGRLIR